MESWKQTLAELSVSLKRQAFLLCGSATVVQTALLAATSGR